MSILFKHFAKATRTEEHQNGFCQKLSTKVSLYTFFFLFVVYIKCFFFVPFRLLQFHNIEIVFDSDTDSQPSEPPRKVRQTKRSRKSSPDGSLQSNDSDGIRPVVVPPTATVTSGGGQMLLDNDVLVGYDQPSLMIDQPIIESKPLLAKILPPYPAAVTSLLSKPLMAAAAAQTKLQHHQTIAATAPSQPPPPLTKDIQTQSKEDISLLRANPNISMRELFPGEEEMGLTVNVPYGSAGLTRTPEGWTKVMTTIQYDEPTRHLWDELQKPYGNQSSFLRHLILLEKYFRQGDLVLSENASGNASIYSTSVQHRLQSFDNRGSAAMNHFLKSSARSGSAAPPLVSHNPPMVTIPAAYSQKTQKARAPNVSEPTSLLKSSYDSRGRPIRYSMPPMLPTKPNDFRSQLGGVPPLMPPSRKDGGKQPETVKCTKTAKIPVGLPPELICINTTMANMQSVKAQMEQQSQHQSVSQASHMLQQQQQLQHQHQTPIAQQPQMPLPQPSPMKLAGELKKPKHSGISVSLSGNSGAMNVGGNAGGISANVANASVGNSVIIPTPNVIRLPEVLSISERNESRNWRPTLMPVTAGPPALNGQLYQTADGRKLPNLVQVQSGGKPYLISIHDYNRMCIVRRERLLRDQMMQRHHHNQQLQSAAAISSSNTTSTVTSIASALQQQSSQSSDSRTANQHLQAMAQSVMQNLPHTSTSNTTVTSRHSLPPPYSKPLPNIIDITSKTPAAPLIPPTPLASSSHTVAHSGSSGGVANSSGKISIPNKILEQNSVIPLTSGSGSSVVATPTATSKSSTLDSLLKVRKPNSATASLLKPNIHQQSVSYQLAPKPLPPVYGPSSTIKNLPSIPAVVCPTTTHSLPPFDPNVISITSTPSISAILGMPPMSGDALSSAAAPLRESAKPSALDILLKSSGGGIPLAQQQNAAVATPPTTTMPTSSMWLWAESLSNNNSNGSSSTSVGSITVTTTAAASASTAALGIDTAAATLLSKIPKSLTVIPQQKSRTSTSSKSSNDDVQIL